MPIGPDIIDHNSEVVSAFNADVLIKQIKDYANKLIQAIDNHLVSITPAPNAKRVTMQLWNINAPPRIYEDAVMLVKNTYILAGWSKVEISDLGYDRFDHCIQVRLYK